MIRTTLEETVRKLLDVNSFGIEQMKDSYVQPYKLELEGVEKEVSLFGLVDCRNHVVICEPRFTYVGRFIDGIAVCKIHNKVGYVKASDATYLIEPSEEYIAAQEPVDGICLLKTSEYKWKLFSCARQDFITKEEFDDVDVIKAEEHDIGMALFEVLKDGERGIIRKDGLWLISCGNATSFEFIARNLIRAVKANGTECLLSIVTNDFILDDVYRITALEKEGYFSYYRPNNRCDILKITDNKGEVILSGYMYYNWLNDVLIACKRTGDEGKYDIFNIQKNSFVIKNVDSCEVSSNPHYWYFEKEQNLGIMNENGEILLKPIADELLLIGENRVKVSINELWGVYSLKTKEWVILPQFALISQQDEIGIYRVGREVNTSKKMFDKRRTLWRYVADDGMFVTKEEFLKAGPFVKSAQHAARMTAYAKVVTLDGRAGKISKEGYFFEE